MNIARTILPIALALACPACAAGAGPEGEGERTGQATEKLIHEVTADGTGDWEYLQYTHDYINELQVDGVLHHSFVAEGNVDFTDFEGKPWTAANIEACASSYIFVDLTKLLNGSWVQWDDIGYVYATAVPSCPNNHCIIEYCYAGFRTALTTFGASTSFNIYQSYVSSDGGSAYGYVAAYEGS